MPSKEEIDNVFAAIVVNGLDFIERSAEELEEAPKFSIAHFATGLELLLKARLFVEHWSLTASDPHACSWSGIKDGSVHTLQASSLCSAIVTTTGTSLQHSKDTFNAVFAHRNKALHWIPSSDIDEAAAEQCRAWYLLHQLLTLSWADHFDRFKDRINAVDRHLLVYRTYLKARYEELKNRLKGPKAKGALFDCPACNFEAGILDTPNSRISDFACPVCQTKGMAGQFDCLKWHALDRLPKGCSCGETHDKQQLLQELGPANHMSPKDRLTAGQTLYSCGECYEQQTVVPVDDGPAGDSQKYVCLNCRTRFDPANGDKTGNCGYCSEEWIGYNTENTDLHGCEFCDGPSFGAD